MSQRIDNGGPKPGRGRSCELKRGGIAPAAKSDSIFNVMQQQGSHCKRLPEAWDTFLVRWDGTVGLRLFGKRNRGQGISTSLLPHEDVNAALPAASIYVDGPKCSALIDTANNHWCRSMPAVEKYELTVDVVLVPSNKNMANQLTRVPQRRLTAMKMENGPKPLIGAIHVDELNADQIMAIHRNSGHPGVQRTTYFIRKICPATPRTAVKMAVRTCEECQSIDPALEHWR